MDMNSKNPQNVSGWITSLAMSVTCCAVLFIIFAGYLADVKKQLVVENAQLEQMEMHQQLLLSEMQSMQKTLANAHLAANPAPSVPTAATPPVGTQLPATSTATVPVPSSAPATITPPAAAPTAVPEIPAK